MRNLSVVVPFLLNYRVVLDNVAEAVVGNGRVRNPKGCAGDNEAQDLLASFSDGPEVAVGAGFRRGVR
jgi:hypothetical protein